MYSFSTGKGQADPSDTTVYLPSSEQAVQTPVPVPDVDVPAEPAEPAVQPEPEPEPEPAPQQADQPQQTAAEAPEPIWVPGRRRSAQGVLGRRPGQG